MVQRHVQVFSSDPTLVSYLAHYLWARSCNLIEEGGKFYLCSSYFEKLPVLPPSVSAAPQSDGLVAVIGLINPAFNTLSTSAKVEERIHAVLLVLNGIIKVKYQDHNGLTRFRSTPSEMGELGIDYEINTSGQSVYSVLHDFKTRAVIGAGEPFFRAADRKKPSMKKVWNIARKNPAVARALYHYAIADQEDRDNLNKVREEIEKDIGYTQLVQWVGQKPMDAFQQWVHNAYVSGGRARHSLAKSDLKKAAATGITPMSLSPINFHILFLQWLLTK